MILVRSLQNALSPDVSLGKANALPCVWGRRGGAPWRARTLRRLLRDVVDDDVGSILLPINAEVSAHHRLELLRLSCSWCRQITTYHPFHNQDVWSIEQTIVVIQRRARLQLPLASVSPGIKGYSFAMLFYRARFTWR